MNKLVFASMVLGLSVNAMASECTLASDWELNQYGSGAGNGLFGEARSVRFDYRERGVSSALYSVYIDDGVNERFLCATDHLNDARNGMLGEVSVGSYPQLSCVFSDHGDLKEFTAVLVKDGGRAGERCARDFFAVDAGNKLFSGQAENMSQSCYSPQQCLLYWRIDSIDTVDYVINEDDGQGTGSNDGGGTGAG